MVAILEKGEHNVDFHPMVDFIKTSPLRYALTVKPTVYVSHIRQFWSTARIETTEEGTKILATIDGIVRTVSESSLRRNLKLRDEEGISSLPDTELFKNLTLMGYNISLNQKFTFQKDEPVSPQRDVSQGEACPTDFSFIADQDRATIAKSSTLPHESTSSVTSLAADEGSLQLRFQELMDFYTSLQRQHSELVLKFTAQALEITKLKARVKSLEDRQGEGINLFGDDAPIKGRRLDEEEVATERVSSDTKEIRLDKREVAAEKVSDDTEEMATVFITMDASSVLLSVGVQVLPTATAVAPANVSISTSGGVVPTASTTISTATPIFATATTVTPYTRRNGKEKMVETHTPKKKKRLQEQIDIQFARELEEQLEREAQRMNAQISKDEEIAKIHAEEELQQMIEGLDRSNETITKHLEENKQATVELTIRERIELISKLVKYQDHHSKILQYQAQQKKTRTKKQKRDFYMAVIRNNLDFIPMGSKEEGERIKMKGLNLKQESAKKQKTSKEVPKEVKSSDEVPKEKIKELIQLVPIEEIDKEDLNQLWALVKETLSVRPAMDEKEMEL
uniref:Xylulose kinase-1 n=1 Tax=Tanacetum cinerariifolium TaxID=118510 RepID=A0A6L2MBB5_TANCI|nr:hypothetical protein [Tanacetum cinerariifolium]